MTTTELITTTIALAKEYHFKNDALNICASKIADELNASIEFGKKVLNANNKRDVFLAKVLGTIQENGYYKDDGFKSAAEFAQVTFGLEKDYCYKLAQAGKTFYNSDSDVRQRVVDALGDSPSKIVELKNVSDEKLKEAIESGAIHSGMTQKELRDFAKAAKPNADKPVYKYGLYVELIGTGRAFHEETAYSEIDAIKAIGELDSVVKIDDASHDDNIFKDIKSHYEAIDKPLPAYEPEHKFFAYEKKTKDAYIINVYKPHDIKTTSKTSKPKTTNIREVTAEQLAEIFGLDIETARAMKAKQAERDAAK